MGMFTDVRLNPYTKKARKALNPGDPVPATPGVAPVQPLLAQGNLQNLAPPAPAAAAPQAPSPLPNLAPAAAIQTPKPVVAAPVQPAVDPNINQWGINTKTDADLVSAAKQKYADIFDMTTTNYKAKADKISTLDYPTLIALLRTPEGKQLFLNQDMATAFESALRKGAAPNTASNRATSGQIYDEFNVSDTDTTLKKLWDAMPALQKTYPTFEAYKNSAVANIPKTVGSGTAKKIFNLASYDQAQDMLKNSKAYADRFNIPEQELTAIASAIIQKGPPPKSDLGDVYVPNLPGFPPIAKPGELPAATQPGQIPATTPTPVADPQQPVANPGITTPILQDQPIGPQVLPSTTPIPTATPTPAAAANPGQISTQMFQANEAYAKAQEDQQRIMLADIEDKQAREVAAARGESVRRGLTGGSFEARKTSAAVTGGQRASAEAMASLALQKAQLERDAQTRAEERQFTTSERTSGQEFTDKQREDQQNFQSEQDSIQRLYAGQQQEIQRAYDSVEAYKNRAFTAGENDKARYYQSVQDELSRQHQLLLAKMQQDFEAAQQRAAARSANGNALTAGLGGITGAVLGNLNIGPFGGTK